MRRLHLRHLAAVRAAAAIAVAFLAAPACRADPEAGRGTAAATGAAPTAAPLALDDFRPGFADDDSAAVALARFLDASLATDDPREAVLRAPTACALGADVVFPTELLAAYEVTGRSTRGDTVVVRARVVTAAQQDRDRRMSDRFVATQRERHGEWEWDVVREDGEWRVCAGPTFGFRAPDSLTTWRPDGASAASAHALAARLADAASS